MHFILTFLGCFFFLAGNTCPTFLLHKRITNMQAHSRICSWQPSSLLGQNRSRLTSSISDYCPYGILRFSIFSNLPVSRRRNTPSCIPQILPSDLRFAHSCIGFEQHLPIYLGLLMLPCLQDMHILLPFVIHSHRV